MKHIALFEDFSQKDRWAIYVCAEKRGYEPDQLKASFEPKDFVKTSRVSWKKLGEIEVKGFANVTEIYDVYISNVSSEDWATKVMYYDVKEECPKDARVGIVNVIDKFTMGSDGEVGKAIVRILNFEDIENANRETLLSLYPGARGQISGKKFGY